MHNNDYIKNTLRSLSAQRPEEWNLSEHNIADITSFLKGLSYRNNLEAKRVLQAGMLLRYLEPKVMPSLFLSWLRNEEQNKSTLESLAMLHNIVLSSTNSEIVKKISETYVFYAGKATVYAENMQYAKKSKLTVKKLQKILDNQSPYSAANLNAFAPFIIELMYYAGIEKLDILPNNLYEFLAAYLNNLAGKNKITPKLVLLAGILLRKQNKSNQNISEEAINILTAVALQATINLQDILIDQEAHKLHPELVDTFLNNIKYLINNVYFDEKGFVIKNNYIKRFQDLIVSLSFDKNDTSKITDLKKILNFLLRCDLSKELTAEYKTIWLSLVVAFANVVYKENEYSDFSAWVDSYCKIPANSAYATYLLNEINMKLPRDFKSSIFGVLRENIKEHLQVYPGDVFAFLHKKKLLNKPGFDMDLYFSEQIMSERDVKRNVIEEYRIEYVRNPNDMIGFVIKIIGKAQKSESALRFNLGAIVQYANKQHTPGYYKFGNLYFSIKANNGFVTIYSPNLNAGPENIKIFDFNKIEAFILKICNNVSTEKIKLLEVLPVQYELELASRSRPTTPLTEHRESKNDSGQLVRAKSASSLPRKKPSFN